MVLLWFPLSWSFQTKLNIQLLVAVLRHLYGSFTKRTHNDLEVNIHVGVDQKFSPLKDMFSFWLNYNEMDVRVIFTIGLLLVKYFWMLWWLTELLSSNLCLVDFGNCRCPLDETLSATTLKNSKLSESWSVHLASNACIFCNEDHLFWSEDNCFNQWADRIHFTPCRQLYCAR